MPPVVQTLNNEITSSADLLAKEAGTRASQMRMTPEGSRLVAAVVPEIEQAAQHTASHVANHSSKALEGVAETLEKASKISQKPVDAAFGISFVGLGAGALGWVSNVVRLEKVSQVFETIGKAANAPLEWMQHTKLSNATNVISSAHNHIGEALEKHGAEALASSIKKQGALVSGWEKEGQALLGNAVGTVTKGISSPLSQLEVSGKAGEAAKALSGSGLGSVISSAPAAIGKSIGNKSVMMAAFQAGSAFSSLSQDVSTYNTFRTKLSQLCELQADLKGCDPETVSPLKLLFEKDETLPLLVRIERNKLKNCIAPAALMSVASNVVSMKMATLFGNQTSTQGGMQGMMALMGAQMASSMLMGATMPHNPVLDLYVAAKEIHATTGKIPVELYADLLANTAPTLQNVGAENVYTKALAQEYANAGISPAAFMAKIESGEVATDLSNVTNQLNAQQSKANIPAATVAQVEPKGRIATQQLAAGVA